MPTLQIYFFPSDSIIVPWNQNLFLYWFHSLPNTNAPFMNHYCPSLVKLRLSFLGSCKVKYGYQAKKKRSNKRWSRTRSERNTNEIWITAIQRGPQLSQTDIKNMITIGYIMEIIASKYLCEIISGSFRSIIPKLNTIISNNPNEDQLSKIYGSYRPYNGKNSFKVLMREKHLEISPSWRQ